MPCLKEKEILGDKGFGIAKCRIAAIVLARFWYVGSMEHLTFIRNGIMMELIHEHFQCMCKLGVGWLQL